MTAITFNSLQFVQDMQDAGMPEKQAKAEAKILSETFSESGKDIATKEHLDLRLAEIRAEIKGEFQLTRWMIGALFAVSALTLSLIVKLVMTSSVTI